MLTCPACGRTYDDRWRCECASPLEFADQPLPAADTPEGCPGVTDRDQGLWSFSAFLPVERRVSLGEGWTPLVDADAAGVGDDADDRDGWDAQFKLESLFPTGSFKDRGATTTVSRALEVGADRLVEDSSGNAGLAIATYAARAGVDATIYVPADAKPGKVAAIERTGVDVERVDGDRQAVTDACIDAVESGDGWYASHAWNPAFFAGTSTVAFEIAAQRGWEVPDAVVTPLGHGTLFLGAYRGFRALLEAGWTDRMPRLLGAQATGAAPIARELHGDRPDETPANDAADGIQIRQPARREGILAAIAETDGDAVAVGPDATEREHRRLSRAGFHVEPTCATATAALETYRERGVLDDEDEVVVALTGSGLKGQGSTGEQRS